MHTSVVGTAFFRGQLPASDAALDKEWQLLSDAMDRAEILGTNVLRTFAFMKPKDRAATDADYARIYELELEAARRAKTRNIRLAIENLGGSYVSKGSESAKLLAGVKADNLGLTWDQNNAAESGEDPYPGGYRLLDPARIFNVHLRDYRHKPDGKVEWAAVGEGEAKNLELMRALIKDGYKGPFSLETHYKDPGGKPAATRKSLTGLLKVVEQV
jgi:sugar phosphate isomerase/epimerase